MGDELSFKVVIIGAGLGGLSCAIACRNRGLGVLVLERAPAITAVSKGSEKR